MPRYTYIFYLLNFDLEYLEGVQSSKEPIYLTLILKMRLTEQFRILFNTFIFASQKENNLIPAAL